MLKRIYWLTGAVIVGMYGLATVSGWQLSNPVKPLVRPDVRRAPNTSPWFGGGSTGGGGFSGGK